MNKAKLQEREAKPEAKQEGYVLTEKGIQTARKQGKWVNSLTDAILRVMSVSPDVPLTKGTLSESLWQKATEILTRLEGEGLVQKAQALSKESKAHVELTKPTVQTTLKDLGMTPVPTPKRTTLKLGKYGFTDKRGTRLSRRQRKGWKPAPH